MSPASENNPSLREILHDRALMLHKARAFFAQRGVTEVDTPILSPFASVDTYIDLLETQVCGERAFLHSSPEYGMKRLLAAGMGDIYQLSHVFRQHDLGAKHSPEFLMAEWYRLGFTLEEMINESAAFITLFLGRDLPVETLSYAEAFKKWVGIEQMDPQKLLKELLIERGEHPPHSTNLLELQDLLYGLYVEPHLGQNTLTVITPFPPERAALAQHILTPQQEKVALRFEIYYQGIELANGYKELLDAEEQEKRLKESNKERVEIGKESLPIDPLFLAALKQGISPCCGVSVGVDRLLMLRHQKEHIQEVTPFSWDS